MQKLTSEPTAAEPQSYSAGCDQSAGSSMAFRGCVLFVIVLGLQVQPYRSVSIWDFMAR